MPSRKIDLAPYTWVNTVQQRFGYHPEIALSNGSDKVMPTVKSTSV